MDRVKQNGFNTYGVDYPSSAIDEVKKKGHIVFEGNFIDLDLPKKHFDVITMWHSLEHVVEPAKVLNKIKTLLKEDGVLMIAVPNLKAKGVDIHDVSWVWIQQPFVHVWHWTPFSLNYLLTSNSLLSIDTFTRDTWDANTIYDGYLQYGFEIKVNKVMNKIDVILSKIFRRKINLFSDKTGFCFIESVRVFAYVLNRMIYLKDRNKGSELIVMSKLTHTQELNRYIRYIRCPLFYPS